MPSRAECSCGSGWDVLRPHDIWVLPVEVLAGVMRIDLIDLGSLPGSPAAAFAGPDGAWIAIRDSLPPKEEEYRVRELLTARLVQAPNPSGTHISRCQKLNITELYGDSQWAPRNGWRSDEEVIASVRSLIDHVLDGVTEGFPEEAYPLPDGLRADLWGFCAALISVGDKSEERADKDGVLYIGKRRRPVMGPGPELLGALTVQRFGRRPGDCAFPLVSPEQLTQRVELPVRDRAAGRFEERFVGVGSVFPTDTEPTEAVCQAVALGATSGGRQFLSRDGVAGGVLAVAACDDMGERGVVPVGDAARPARPSGHARVQAECLAKVFPTGASVQYVQDSAQQQRLDPLPQIIGSAPYKVLTAATGKLWLGRLTASPSGTDAWR